MDWDEAIAEAREYFGYSQYDYVDDWDMVVREAKSILKGAKKEEYHEYLQSGKWKQTRAVVLKRDNNRCVDCGAVAQEVHHESYENVCIDFDEFDYIDGDEVSDCVSLCSNCHRGRHNQ